MAVKEIYTDLQVQLLNAQAAISEVLKHARSLKVEHFHELSMMLQHLEDIRKEL